MDELKQMIREIPDYPKPGILFYDITTLLKDPKGLRLLLEKFRALYLGHHVDKIVGIESRGFFLGPHLAYELGAGFVPVRKLGKLPGPTLQESYDLEYGSDHLEMHEDAITPGEKVLIVDDLIATGGTALATAKLVETCGADLLGFAFAVELTALPGREKLAGYEVRSLLSY